jgi:hypothetical protein
MFASYKGLSGEEFPFGPEFWSHRSLQKPRLEVNRRGTNCTGVKTDTPAFSIYLDADEFLPDDNFFDLMPGEEKVVRFGKDLPSGEFGMSSLNDVVIFLRNRVPRSHIEGLSR